MEALTLPTAVQQLSLDEVYQPDQPHAELILPWIHEELEDFVSLPIGYDHTPEEWEEQRELFTRLYSVEDKALKEVKGLMEELRGFRATERQYKRRIALWKLEKNIKDSDMRVIARKQLKRKIDDGKATQFAIGGRPVQNQKIQRFIKRKNLPQKDILEGGIPTPAYITWETPAGDTAEEDMNESTDSTIKDQQESTRDVEGDSKDLKSTVVNNKLQATNSLIDLIADSPFERYSPRYHISSSPGWYRSAITPSNPLSLLSPFPGRSETTASDSVVSQRPPVPKFLKSYKKTAKMKRAEPSKVKDLSFKNGQRVKVMAQSITFIATWDCDAYYAQRIEPCSTCLCRTRVIYRSNTMEGDWEGRHICNYCHGLFDIGPRTSSTVGYSYQLSWISNLYHRSLSSDCVMLC